MRTCFGMRCTIQRAEVIRPSQPSFWMPGRPARNLSVTSLPRPSLRNTAPGMSRRSLRSSFLPLASKYFSSKDAIGASWILPRLWSMRVTSSHFASGVTMRHEARLSSAVPQSTAFLPPAFMATLPPMHEASAEVGIDGEDIAGALGRIGDALGHHAGLGPYRRHLAVDAGQHHRLHLGHRLELFGIDDGALPAQAAWRRRCSRCRRRAG